MNMDYDITISISKVKTNNPFELEKLCIMMTQVCKTMCEACDFSTVNVFDIPVYEMKELKE